MTPPSAAARFDARNPANQMWRLSRGHRKPASHVRDANVDGVRSRNARRLTAGECRRRFACGRSTPATATNPRNGPLRFQAPGGFRSASMCRSSFPDRLGKRVAEWSREIANTKSLAFELDEAPIGLPAPGAEKREAFTHAPSNWCCAAGDQRADLRGRADLAARYGRQCAALCEEYCMTWSEDRRSRQGNL